MIKKTNGFNPRPTFPKSPRPKKDKTLVATDSFIDKLELRERENEIRNTQNANSTEDALCGQLMLISTVFLTITVAVTANQDTLSSLSYRVKILIISALISLLLSIASGIIYYFKNVSFYRDWSKVHDKNANLLSDRFNEDWEEVRQKLVAHDKELNSESNNSWLKVQISFMALSALMYIAAVTGLLFNFGFK